MANAVTEQGDIRVNNPPEQSKSRGKRVLVVALMSLGLVAIVFAGLGLHHDLGFISHTFNHLDRGIYKGILGVGIVGLVVGYFVPSQGKKVKFSETPLVPAQHSRPSTDEVREYFAAFYQHQPGDDDALDAGEFINEGWISIQEENHNKAAARQGVEVVGDVRPVFLRDRHQHLQQNSIPCN